jgi:hypothetical protein
MFTRAPCSSFARSGLARLIIALAVVSGVGTLVGGTLSSSAARHFASSPETAYPFTGFGGYYLSHKVTTISASWRVPKIRLNSHEGFAATWIGAAQANGAPFIQIGTLEDQGTQDNPGYEAFWSDTALDFVPQEFGDIQPGDKIIVAMVRKHRDWFLHFSDPSSFLRWNEVFPYGRHANFNQSEVMQEDPTPGLIAGHDLPYPVIANVTFTKVLINGSISYLNKSDAQVLMSNGGTISIPTKFRNDSFTLVAPRGNAERYLKAETTMNLAETTYKADTAQWKSLSRGARMSDVQYVINTYKTSANEFSTQTWPTRLRSEIRGIDYVVHSLEDDLHRWSNSGFDSKGATHDQIQVDIYRVEDAANLVRGSLNLPTR